MARYSVNLRSPGNTLSGFARVALPVLSFKKWALPPGQENPVQVRITYNSNQLVKILAALEAMEGYAREGCARAANDAAKIVRDRLVEQIAADMTCPREDVERVIKIDAVAAESDPAASVRIVMRKIPLTQFGAAENATGVTATTQRSRGARTVRRGFIAQNRRGRYAVFKRTGRPRYPIREVFGPSVYSVAKRKMPKTLAEAQRTLLRELYEERNIIVDRTYAIAGWQRLALPFGYEPY